MIAIIGSICVFHPSGETWGLIVQEQATVAYSRLSVSICSFANKYLVVFCSRHVGPPIPWRHAQLARELIDTINSTTSVATCND